MIGCMSGRSKHALNDVLRDIVVQRPFSQLDNDAALAYFCTVLSDTLDAPRASIWILDSARDALMCRTLQDRSPGSDHSVRLLTREDAPVYFQAITSEVALPIADALSDDRCVELRTGYLDTTGVSALLDCPLRTYGGLVGVVCIEKTGERYDWPEEDIDFALAIASLISLTLEHEEREIAEREAFSLESRLRTYTDLVTDWFWETDAQFRFTRLYGNTANNGQIPADYEGRVLWETPLEPRTGSWDTLKSRVAEHKRIYEFVVVYTAPDGQRHYAELSGIARFDTAGHYTGYWGTAKDVSVRIHQENALIESERMYRSATRLARLGSWTWDEVDDRCSYCSPELAEIYGVSVEHYLERSNTAEKDLLWFHPDDRQRYWQVIRQARERQTGYEITARIVRDDGSVRTLHEITEAVFDEHGVFVATAGILQDITELTDLQRQLQIQESMLRSIVDNIPGAVYRVNNDDRMTPLYRSKGYVKTFIDASRSPNGDDPALDKLVPDIPVDVRQQIGERLREAVANDTPYEVEYPITLKDGTRKWVLDRGRPVRGTGGEIQFEGIMLDATDKHDAQAALSHAQRLEGIGLLTGGIAHDFSNLLAVIRGNLEQLRDTVHTPQQFSCIDTGIEAVDDGARLVRSMLAFARRSPLHLESIDLNTLMRKIERWVRRMLPANIHIDLILEEGLTRVVADRSTTESVVVNLIVNARDAMPEGGRLRIETASRYLPESMCTVAGEVLEPGLYATITVQDSGNGIPSDQLSRIFEPFFTTKPTEFGSGLGLAMAHGSMSQSGGAIDVASTLHAGSTFTLYFDTRRHRAEASPDDVADKPLDTPAPEHSPPPTGVKPSRILIVEDDHRIRAILKAMLSPLGHSLVAASSGEKAQALFADGEPFDLLLTDLSLPGAIQGDRLASLLQQRNPTLPVIYLTGKADALSESGKRASSRELLLHKPVSRQALIAAVDRALTTSSPQSDSAGTRPVSER